MIKREKARVYKEKLEGKKESSREIRKDEREKWRRGEGEDCKHTLIDQERVPRREKTHERG